MLVNPVGEGLFHLLIRGRIARKCSLKKHFVVDVTMSCGEKRMPLDGISVRTLGHK